MVLTSAGRAAFAAGLVSAVLAAQAESSDACSGGQCRSLDEDAEDATGLMQLRESSSKRSLTAHASAELRRTDDGQCIGLADVFEGELAILAEDVAPGVEVIPSVLTDLGWSRGPYMEVECPLTHSVDRANVYQKGCQQTLDGTNVCDYCVVAFSPENDRLNFLDTHETSYCGIDGQHSGFVKSLRNFYPTDGWIPVQEAIAPNGCCRTYATGYSRGGALASLFAFCANQRDVPDDQSDRFYYEATPTARSGAVKLITFGQPRVGLESMWNNQKPTCFQGGRYVITDNDVPWFGSPEAFLEGLDVVACTYWDAWLIYPWMKLRHDLIRLHALLRLNLEDQFYALLQAVVTKNIDPSMRAVYAMLTEDWLPWVPKAKERWSEYVNKHKALFTWSYDPVPSLRPGTFPVHMVFQNVKLDSIAHPPPAAGAIDFGHIECNSTKTTFEPLANYLQTLGGIVGNALENPGATEFYPNHKACCYIQALNWNVYSRGCGTELFGNASLDCPVSKWR